MRIAPVLRKWAAALGFLLGAASLASAQQVTIGNLPPNTVVGRLGSSVSGPAQAIPFVTLETQLAPSILNGATVLCAVGSLTCYFSNPNTTVATLNRLYVGEVALNGNSNFPMSPADWLETILGGSISLAQIGSVSAIGGAGVLGASRTSDYRTAFSAVAPSTIGIEGVAENNDTIGGTPIAVAVDGVAIANSNIGITVGSQLDINSLNTPVTVGPFSGIPQGSTIAALLTTGFDAAIATKNVSAAWVAAPGRGGGPVFGAGGVCQTASLDTTVGSAGGGVCLAMAAGQEIFWQESGLGTSAEIWGDSSGNIVLDPTGGGIINAAGTLAVKGGSLGYQTGQGNCGVVTQITSITTGVTINKICGVITTVSNTFTAGTLVQFVVTNSKVAATDTIILSSQTGSLFAAANAVSATSFDIVLDPLTNGTTSVVINYAIIKSGSN